MTAPSSVFNIKQGDVLPVIKEILRNAPVYPSTVPLPIDLSGVGTSVRFHLIDVHGATVVNAAAAIVDGANGIVSYTWQPADTVVAGDFWREWEVTLSIGVTVTVPNDRRGYIVHIERQAI